jgi:uncharacterized protein YggU (UPF0235/DUF167 family)
MEVIAKVRFNASKERIESFGMNKYLVYLPFPEEGNSLNVVIEVLSRQMGIPRKNIILKRKALVTNDLVFEVN